MLSQARTLALACTALPILATMAAASSSSASSSAVPSLRSRERGTFIGGLVGDALALGGHYEYDASVIASKVGSYTDFQAPTINYGVGWGRANYHPGAKAGDVTDVGAVSIMLLEHLVASPSYTFDGYAAHWLKRHQDGYGSCNFMSVGREWTGPCPAGTFPGYINGGSRRTLEALKQYPHVKGDQRKAIAADVNCLASATHFAPLFLLPNMKEDALVRDAVSTVYLSHKNRDPVAAAAFLSRAIYRIIHGGETLEGALRSSAATQKDAFISARLEEALAKVAEAADDKSQLASQKFIDDIAVTSLARLWEVGKEEPIKIGKASPVEGALPASLYFALRYQDSLEKALIANANIGGDSAARGIVIGMLLGAVHGEEAVPARWIKTLNVLPRVNTLIAELEAKQAPKQDVEKKSEL